VKCVGAGILNLFVFVCRCDFDFFFFFLNNLRHFLFVAGMVSYFVRTGGLVCSICFSLSVQELLTFINSFNGHTTETIFNALVRLRNTLEVRICDAPEVSLPSVIPAQLPDATCADPLGVVEATASATTASVPVAVPTGLRDAAPDIAITAATQTDTLTDEPTLPLAVVPEVVLDSDDDQEAYPHPVSLCAEHDARWGRGAAVCPGCGRSLCALCVAMRSQSYDAPDQLVASADIAQQLDILTLDSARTKMALLLTEQAYVCVVMFRTVFFICVVLVCVFFSLSHFDVCSKKSIFLSVSVCAAASPGF
jgi:hypothetical protein